MPSRTIRLTVGLAALLLTLPAFAGKVYQWKDAQGVTHYSDAPPPAQAGVKNRQMKDSPSTASQAAAQPAETPNCVTARKNLERLKTSGPVGFDANGDGKVDKEMSAEERAKEVQRTEFVLKAQCAKPANQP